MFSVAPLVVSSNLKSCPQLGNCDIIGVILIWIMFAGCGPVALQPRYALFGIWPTQQIKGHYILASEADLANFVNLSSSVFTNLEVFQQHSSVVINHKIITFKPTPVTRTFQL